jgi:hypothetical protein
LVGVGIGVNVVVLVVLVVFVGCAARWWGARGEDETQGIGHVGREA